MLIRRDGAVKNATLYTEADEFLAKPWTLDLYGNRELRSYAFTRRPLVIQAQVDYHGEMYPLFAVAIHTKSKLIAHGEQLWSSPLLTDKNLYIEKAVRNRRRIAAEWYVHLFNHLFNHLVNKLLLVFMLFLTLFITISIVLELASALINSSSHAIVNHLLLYRAT